MIDVLITYFQVSGFGQCTFGNATMILVGLLFIFLAVKKGFEPLLLVPIGFGMIVGNIPYLTNQLSLGVYDGPPDPSFLDKVYLPESVLLRTEDGRYIKLPSLLVFPPDANKLDRLPSGDYPPPSVIVDTSHTYGFPEIASSTAANLPIHEPVDVDEYFSNPNSYDEFRIISKRVDRIEAGDVLVIQLNQGRLVLADAREDAAVTGQEDWPQIIRPEQMNPWNASVLWYLYRGVKWGFYPALIFLGIGAMTDFSCLLANPKLFLLGAAAQIGIFGALTMSILLGFDMNEAASIGIIGGADGPTAIFVTARLAPHMLGTIALAAYSYMALVPIIQPPIMKLLTTQEERLIRMHRTKEVSQSVKVMFPLVGFLLTAFIAPRRVGSFGDVVLWQSTQRIVGYRPFGHDRPYRDDRYRDDPVGVNSWCNNNGKQLFNMGNSRRVCYGSNGIRRGDGWRRVIRQTDAAIY